MQKRGKRVLRVLLCVVLAIVLIVGVYVLYIVLQYNRIEDNAALQIDNPVQTPLTAGAGQDYTALTYNIGFGAYNHDFSFFMDTGVMTDGTPVSGKNARAQSLDIVMQNTTGVLETAQGLGPDFLLMQEVDTKADRSWKVDQMAMISGAFAEYSSVYALNFHSAYLAYPLNEPHGAVEAGLLSLSRYEVGSAVRRSLPVDMSFPTKFFDLDRCFSVLRLPVEGGGELALVNMHMSAYDEGGLIRAAQMEMLSGFLAEEREKGNWVIVGGDFNHALGGTVETFPSQQQVPEWVAVFDESALPEGFSVVRAENADSVATCRSTDMPYQPGVSYTTVLDGFIVSNNVNAAAENIDTDFEFSDHNPVLLRFELL